MTMTNGDYDEDDGDGDGDDNIDDLLCKNMTTINMIMIMRQT